MKSALHILHVEDSVEDSELVGEMLRKGGLPCAIDRVESEKLLRESLEKTEYDLILSDCTLPSFSGLEALEIVHEIKPQTPFVFVSGTIGEEMAIQSLQNGATDYVLKQKLSRLVPAVRRALAQTKEKNLRMAMDRYLRQKRQMEAMGTLTGGLAHDFRNLLQVLKMGIGLLLLKSNDSDEILRIADMLDKTADRGTEIMQELLVFGQKADARLVSIDVREQIGRTMEMLKTGLPSNVNLVVQLEDELPPIYADPGQLDWILANLVVNAKDAMPDGGTITITGKMIQFAPESARSLPIDMPMHKASYLCLTVSDTGVGMEESTLQKAFEPFFTTKPLGKGTGLGLSVVFGLMESHNGFIDIQSKPGQGAAISLFFPLPQPQKPEPKDELSAALA